MEKEHRLIGYARVSTDDQDTALQRKALVEYGVKPEHIKEEYASGGTMNRPEWNKIMRYMRNGDTVVVWKLDRLGRTVSGIINTLEDMEKSGVNLVSVTESIDTKSAMGKMFMTVIAAFAQLERDLIGERTKAGIAVRRAAGAKWGRRGQIDSSPKRVKRMKRYIETGEMEHITA